MFLVFLQNLQESTCARESSVTHLWETPANFSNILKTRFFSKHLLMNASVPVWFFASRSLSTLEYTLRYNIYLEQLMVCMFLLFISFHCKGFSWMNQTINVMAEFRSAMACWGNFSVSSTFFAASKKFGSLQPQRSSSGAVLTQHKGKYCRTVSTPRGVLITREGLSNLVWSVLTQVLTLQLRRSVEPVNLTVVAVMLSWALLVDALCWNVLEG